MPAVSKDNRPPEPHQDLAELAKRIEAAYQAGMAEPPPTPEEEAAYRRQVEDQLADPSSPAWVAAQLVWRFLQMPGVLGRLDDRHKFKCGRTPGSLERVDEIEVVRGWFVQHIRSLVWLAYHAKEFEATSPGAIMDRVLRDGHFHLF
jgi:hypothetical protein